MEAKLTGAVIAGIEAISPCTTVAADDLFSVSGAGRRRMSAALVAKHENGIVTNATLAAFISPAANRARQGWAAVEQLAFVGGSHDAASFFLPAIPRGLARIVDVARGCRATEGAANVEMVTVLRGGVSFPSLEEPPLQGRLLAV
jgi:hypothetical protein